MEGRMDIPVNLPNAQQDRQPNQESQNSIPTQHLHLTSSKRQRSTRWLGRRTRFRTSSSTSLNGGRGLETRHGHATRREIHRCRCISRRQTLVEFRIDKDGTAACACGREVWSSVRDVSVRVECAGDGPGDVGERDRGDVGVCVACHLGY